MPFVIEVSGKENIVPVRLLSRERLRGSHSHPACWNKDMREVLVRFTNEEDLGQLCVCKADELSASGKE